MSKLTSTEENLFADLDKNKDKQAPASSRAGRTQQKQRSRRSPRRPGKGASMDAPDNTVARTLPVLPAVHVNVPIAKTSMEELFKNNKAAFHVPQVNDSLKTKVISRSANEVRLSIEGYGVGVVRGRELFDELDEYSKLKPGEIIEATVVELENENGELELSFRRAGRERVWKKVLEKMTNNDILSVKINDANKGGLIVSYQGVQGFVPVSQLTIEHYPRVEEGNKQQILEKLQSYVDESFKLKIIDADPAEEKLIFSEKAAQLESKKDEIDKLQVGDVVEGKVTGIVDFGAFVQFDDMEGLVHISEMAWQRIDNPRDIIKVGETIKAQIIGLDGGRISLSMKKLMRDPWLDAVKKYSVGQTVTGTISKVTPFGAFVQLDDDIHGLVHISELALEPVKDPAEVVAVGDKKEFKILSIEPGEHRLGLSIKAALEEKAGITSESSKISLEEMEKMAEAKSAAKSAKADQTKSSKAKELVPDILAEKSEKALLDEKKHKKSRAKKEVSKESAKKSKSTVKTESAIKSKSAKSKK